MRPRCAGVHILPLNHAQNLLKTYHSEFPKGLLGGFLMTILGAVAELERENIVERVKSGLQAAKNRGIHVGRRRALSQQACKDILNSIKCGEMVSDIARRYSVSRATVYRSIDRI
jgi:DNA invertase Pin-like site-specific DNA recombinase